MAFRLRYGKESSTSICDWPWEEFWPAPQAKAFHLLKELDLGSSSRRITSVHRDRAELSEARRRIGHGDPNGPAGLQQGVDLHSGPNDDVVQPEGSEKLDWEVELAFYIGTKAQRVSKEDALKYVAGYCLANDVSERDWQANRSGLGWRILTVTAEAPSPIRNGDRRSARLGPNAG